MNKNDFPIFAKNSKLVFLDSAASAQKPKVVIDSMSDFMENSYANVHRGLYDLSEKATAAYESARSTVAKFINANTEEIVFTQSATLGLNLLAFALERDSKPELEGKILLTTELEHHSNFIPWQQLAKRLNLEFKVLPIDKNMQLDLVELQKLLEKGNISLFAFSMMSNVLGTITPTEQVVTIIKKFSPKTLIVADACQFAAHYPLDVKQLRIDFLVFSGHKVYGPTGIGVLYGRRSLLEKIPPLAYGGGMIKEVNKLNSTWDEIPHKHEAGTPPIVEAVGLEAAIKYITELGFAKITAHEEEISSYAIAHLQNLDWLKIYHPNDQITPVISFIAEDIHPHDLAQILAESGIAVRAGHHCAQILHRNVLNIAATTRVSLGIYNEYQDIDKLITALIKAKDTFL